MRSAVGAVLRMAGLLAVFALVSGAASPSAPRHLDRLRLLPPVLLKGEKGYDLSERMRWYKVEGVSVAVIKDFRVLWTEARGFADREEKKPATAQTLFQAGSISKPVAAAAVLRRVEKGELSLDRDVNDYLKSWKLPESPLTEKQRVTLARILSHSAGLTVNGFPGYAAGEPVPAVPQVLDGIPPANNEPVRVETEPGSKWNYSGGGYTIAQLVMTDTSGRPFPELARELVLGPAGMIHSTYEQPLPPAKLRLAAAGYRASGEAVEGKRHTYPEMAAAGLWTTSEDLARFGIAIAGSLRGDRGSLLSKEMARRMTTPSIGQTGLGLFIDRHGKETYFGHQGSDEGFNAYLLVHLDKGFGAAVMTNSDNGSELSNEILRAIARQYGWPGYLPEPIATAKLSPADLVPLSGRYRLNSDEAFLLSVRGDRVFGKPPLGDEYELFPISRGLFVRTDRSTRYQVEASKDGVTGITVIIGDRHFTATRMAMGERIPSDDLAEGKLQEAAAAYHKLFAAKPEDLAVAEPRLNQTGYELAARKDFPRALAVLKVNTELYPASTNAYDSLAEVYLLSGDRVRALETYRKVLEVVEKDKKTEANVKTRLRNNAERKVEELSR
jgi:CubicO group peptidase (beta-lactamase class C family)